jgi:hypothetical protein
MFIRSTPPRYVQNFIRGILGRYACVKTLGHPEKLSFCLISSLCSKNYPRHIRYMPALIFFACLDLMQKSLFFKVAFKHTLVLSKNSRFAKGTIGVYFAGYIFSAFCLLPSAFCLLPSAFCLLNIDNILVYKALPAGHQCSQLVPESRQ